MLPVLPAYVQDEAVAVAGKFILDQSTGLDAHMWSALASSISALQSATEYG